MKFKPKLQNLLKSRYGEGIPGRPARPLQNLGQKPPESLQGACGLTRTPRGGKEAGRHAHTVQGPSSTEQASVTQCKDLVHQLRRWKEPQPAFPQTFWAALVMGAGCPLLREHPRGARQGAPAGSLHPVPEDNQGVKLERGRKIRKKYG